jgi:hypothetical protein
MTVEFTAVPLPAQPLGDRSVGVRISGNVGAVGVVLDEDVVAVRSGGLFILVVSVAQGSVDPAATRSIVDTAYRKATRS